MWLIDSTFLFFGGGSEDGRKGMLGSWFLPQLLGSFFVCAAFMVVLIGFASLLGWETEGGVALVETEGGVALMK